MCSFLCLLKPFLCILLFFCPGLLYLTSKFSSHPTFLVSSLPPPEFPALVSSLRGHYFGCTYIHLAFWLLYDSSIKFCGFPVYVSHLKFNFKIRTTSCLKNKKWSIYSGKPHFHFCPSPCGRQVLPAEHRSYFLVCLLWIYANKQMVSILVPTVVHTHGSAAFHEFSLFNLVPYWWVPVFLSLLFWTVQ